MLSKFPNPPRLATCSCGQLQARVAAEPVRVSVCHCLNCKRRSGSAFAAQARFPRAAVTVTGDRREYVLVGDAGGQATFRFCPHCGATVYYTMAGNDDEMAIPIGAFADPSFPWPEYSVYEDRKHGWLQLADSIQHIT